MTEAQWQAQVIDLAHLYRWRVSHFAPARTEKGWRTPVRADGAGYPDLTLAKRGLPLILAELKSDTGRLSADQETWLDVLAEVPGVEVYVWRPRDADLVHAALRRRPLEVAA